MAVRKMLLWLAVLGLGWTTLAMAEDKPVDRPQNVILMGWDGAHRDHVKALLKDDKLPNLKKLIAEGTLVDIDVTSGATDTKAGWTQILTGYKPEVTGVYNNGKYRDVPAGYSIFERTKAQFGADKFAAVAVIGKKGHCGEIDAPFKRPYDPAADGGGEKTGKKEGAKQSGAKKAKKPGQVVEENGQKFLVFEGSPYYTMHKACNEWFFGLTEDAKVGDKALEMLDKYKDTPFFFFVHCAEVDHSGHKFGEPSKEYNDAIVSGDTQLGRLVEKLKALNLYEKTRIYVTADHGFDVGGEGHGYAPYVFLATNDKKVMRDGTRADIAPTVLDSFGLDLSRIEPRLDGESLRAAATKPVEKAPATKPGGRAGKKNKKAEKDAPRHAVLPAALPQ
jgi:arylsulfatase A-like enzyme